MQRRYQPGGQAWSSVLFDSPCHGCNWWDPIDDLEVLRKLAPATCLPWSSYPSSDHPRSLPYRFFELLETEPRQLLAMPSVMLPGAASHGNRTGLPDLNTLTEASACGDG
jgi:hypothetical protein